MVRNAIVVGLLIAVSSSAAFAACTSQNGLICGTAIPRISAPGDELQVSRGGDYAPIASGVSLRSGDRVLAGPTGATLSLGPSCTRPVGAGAMVSIMRTGGRLCSAVTEPLAGVEVSGLTQPTFPVGTAVLAAGAAAGIGIGIAAATHGRNRSPIALPATVSAQ